MNTLTVKKLIEKLEELVKSNPDVADMPVSMEGCDCDGDAGDAEVITSKVSKETYVYLRRVQL